MKSLFTYLCACVLMLFACSSPTQKNNAGQDDGTPPDSAAGAEIAPVSDPLIAKFTDSTGRLQVVSGQAAGMLRLKTPSDTLLQLLGKADSVAADMCKDLSGWFSESAGLRVYALCDNDLDMRKSIQVIAVNGAAFATEEGITGESTFPEIRKAYPGIQVVGKVAQNPSPLFIADHVEKGIAFELSDTTESGRVLGVLVHLPDKAVAATTIPFYPGLEKR